MLLTERISTAQRTEVLDITPRVRELVQNAGIAGGICVVYVPHTTAAGSINENADPDVKHDVLAKLERLVPDRESYYRHAEGNSYAHLKTILPGPSVTLIIDRGRLVLGRWQGIYFCEFDGPRSRTYHVKLLADLPG